MKYDVGTFTYGVELEYADVKFGTPLPDGCQWNQMDNTMVNSDGIANDPFGKLWEFGGEINTKPTSTVEEQVEIIKQINSNLEQSGYPAHINYRNNLHVHVRVPGLNTNLEDCKRLMQYNLDNAKSAFSLIESVPKPVKGQMSKDAYVGAMKRYHRRFRSHQFMMPKSRIDAIMNSKSVQEFFEEHAPLTDKGRMWFFSPREGINLRQMWEVTHTIEFRHFPGTINMVEMESCIRWCREYLNAALNTGETPNEIIANSTKPFVFPKFAEYNHDLECGYQLTNFAHNSRSVVAERLKRYKETGILSA